MICSKDEVAKVAADCIQAVLDKKAYGEYGIFITVHEGSPVKLTEINQMNIIRRPGGKVEIQK